MNKSTKFSPEVRERAMRMVQEHRGEYPSLWSAVESMARKIGCVPQTLLSWIQRHEVDTGARKGVTTAETQQVKELEHEVKELRRANEILKLARAFFPRWSSTADSSPEGLHRHVSKHLRGRADLQGLAGRPVGVSATRSGSAGADPELCTRQTRRDAGAGDRTYLEGQPAGLRCRQGLAAAGSRGDDGGAVHGRAIDAATRLARCDARQGGAHDAQRSQGAMPLGSGPVAPAFPSCSVVSWRACNASAASG
jgi:transposase